MKIFILFLLFSICYINVSGNVILETSVACASKLLGCTRPLSRNRNLDVSKIDVYFYDFKNHATISFPIDGAARGILSIRNLNKAKKFYIYVGGFKSQIEKKSTDIIRDAFRPIPNSYLIIVDHSKYTHDRDGYFKSYKRSVNHVPYIGKKLAEMLAGLKAGGVSPKNIHCIGHSLGGQILGYVGANFYTLTHQKIARITALDPAGPAFDKKSEHVRSGVGDYVEVYHCNDGVLGSQKVFGDVDFFANNGKTQPGCGNPSLSVCKALKTSKCSHKTCVRMWADSLQHRDGYQAYKCKEYKDFVRGKCSRNAQTTAGFWNPGTATGKFFFFTNGYRCN